MSDVYVAEYAFRFDQHCNPCLPEVVIKLHWAGLGAFMMLADESGVRLIDSPREQFNGSIGHWGDFKEMLGFSQSELKEKIREKGLKKLEFEVEVIHPLWQCFREGLPLNPEKIAERFTRYADEVQELSDKVSRRNLLIENLRKGIKQLAKDSKEEDC